MDFYSFKNHMQRLVVIDFPHHTLFFSARLPKKGNFVTKKMMYKIEIFIKNSYVTYISVYTLLFYCITISNKLKFKKNLKNAQLKFLFQTIKIPSKKKCV